MARNFGSDKRFLKRAAAAVYVLLCTTVALGFAAMAVDVGMLYSAKSELQRTADACAMAAAKGMITDGTVSAETNARNTAVDFATRNTVLGAPVGLSPTQDIELGTATLNTGTGQWVFAPSSGGYNAVRVTVRRTANSPSGAIGLNFSKIFGKSSQDVQARATAMLIPRDIAVVVDLSGSMNWDSQLRYYNRTDGGYSNLRDIWCALNGPECSRPYVPGAPTATEYAGDTGPTIGGMSNWGSQLVSGYSAASDAGLWYIKKSTALTSPTSTAVDTALAAKGYSADERSIIKGSTNDGNTNHWYNRVGVMLGLATWKSGRSGGLYPTGGNGKTTQDNSEMTWIAYPSFRANSTWSWPTYIDFVQSNSTYNNSSGGTPQCTVFRYRYGLKTFTDFLLINWRQFDQTNVLWQTPEEPQRAIKDAVKELADTILAQTSLDQLSLEIFGTTGHHEYNLTHDLEQIPNHLYGMQAAHYDGSTNIGIGLQLAISELKSSRARSNAAKVIVLLSDGIPNVDSAGNTTSDGASGAVNWAYSQAQAAANLGFTIYTISVGTAADRSVLQQIAAIGHGQEFYAAGNPQEYADQLTAIFRTLGGKREVVLIE